MPRRKVGKEKTRNIQRSGVSYHISLPIKIVKELRWKERQKVVVKKYGKGIKITDWKK